MAIDFEPIDQSKKIDFKPVSQPAPGPNSNMTDASKPDYMGPPNEPGLEQVIPVTDPIKMGLGALADKSAQFRTSEPPAQSMLGRGAQMVGNTAMRAGEMGLRGAQSLVPSEAPEVAATIAAGPVGQIAGDAIKGVSAPISKYGGKAASYVGDHLSELAGYMSGKDPEYIKAVFNNPGIMKKVGEQIGLDIQKSATDAIALGRKALGDKVEAAEDGLAMFGTDAVSGKSPIVDLKTPLKGIVSQLESKGHYVPKELGGRAVPMKKYAIDPVSDEGRMIAGYLKDLNQEMDFGEALNLKRDLDRTINYGKQGSNGLQPVTGPANAILKNIRSQVKDAMTKSIPDAQSREHWLAVNKAASEGYQAFDNLHSQVMGSQPYQTASRIARNIKNQSVEEQVLGPAAKISKKAEEAVQEIRDRVVAAQFKRRYGGMNASHFLPSSPRAFGQLTALLGSGSQISQGAMTALSHFALSHPNLTGYSLAKLVAKEAQGGQK
jgi:hypothetical protein